MRYYELTMKRRLRRSRTAARSLSSYLNIEIKHLTKRGRLTIFISVMFCSFELKEMLFLMISVMDFNAF
jgi:hypothetical protein